MKLFAFFTLLLIVLYPCKAQQLPPGSVVQYKQNFSAAKSLGDFYFNQPRNWGLFNKDKNYFLKLTPQNLSVSDSLLPANRAVLKNAILGDFVWETAVKPLAEGNTPQIICFMLGLKDSTRYYLIELSAGNRDTQQGIYLVKNSRKILLSFSDSTSSTLRPQVWQKIRIERNITSRTIRVFIDDQVQPVLVVKDYELVIGRIGFGTLSGAAAFDNITVWAPTLIPEEEFEKMVN